MNTDDTVVYSQQHFEWLTACNMWVSRHIPRTAFRGRVTGIRENGLVEVLWYNDKKQPSRLHFPENLEVEV